MKRLTAGLAAAVVVKMVFHALYLPAFEGPDEPQHLARVMAFSRGAVRDAVEGRWVAGDIGAAVLAYPCPHPELGCPSYASSPGIFNLLRPAALRPRLASRFPNEEAKQPPLFYLLAGLLLRPFGTRLDPASALLIVRLLSVTLVAVALFGPLRQLFRGSPSLELAGLVAMLSPGAGEAFARCSNDAAVFLWAALVLAALDGRPPTWRFAVLLAAGPLLKLTALPISAFAVGALWVDRRKGAAAVAAMTSSLFLPVQAWRGWLTGGALELQRQRPAIDETSAGWLLGLARTAYTLLKAPFWAMGWSLLRPPSTLLASYFGVLIATLFGIRRARRPRRLLPHVLAAVVVLAGTLVYAVATRGYYGVWGGVTGWYVWDWSPWLAVAARDLCQSRERWLGPIITAESLFVLAANAVWLAQSAVAYGG